MTIEFRFHHVGIVTRGLNACRRLYTVLGYASSEVFSDPHQKADIVLLERPGSPMVELIAPTDPQSPASSWAERIQAGPYHTCYEVESLERAIEQLEEHQVLPVMAPVPAVAFGMRRVTFLLGARSGLLELLEAAPTSRDG